MKRIVVFLTIAMLAFLAIGCGQAADEPTLPANKPVPAAPSVPLKTAPMPEPEPEPVKEVSSEVAKLLEVHTKRNIKSLTYFYSDPINKQSSDVFHVKGDRMVIELFEPSSYDKKTYFNTVYLDLVSEEAVAYCEAESRVLCEDPNKEFDVRFDDYVRPTPLDWINMVEYAEKTGGEMVDSRFVNKLEFDEGGVNYALFVDEYYGLPIRVEVTGGPEEGKYEYIDMFLNSVDDDRMYHQHYDD